MSSGRHGLDPEHVLRRRLERDGDLGGGDRHALARPDQDGHAGPAPGIGGQPDRDVGLHRRMRVDAVDVEVAVVLAADRVLRGQRAQRVHHLLLGVPPAGQARAGRRFGQHGGQHLEHVVLQHVPDGAGPVVEPAAVGDVERLGHGDLDVVDVVAVQQRLDDRVGEPGEQHVLHRVEGQPVVDPEDGLLREVLVHGVVELLRAGQVGAERLLHHDPGAAGPGPRWRSPAAIRPNSCGRHFQVVQDPLAGADLIGHGLVGGVVAQVAVHVPQQAEHLDRRRVGRVHLVELERRGRVVAELLQAPAALGHPDHRDVEHAALDQPHQRGEGLQLGQVPGSAEDHQRVNFVGHIDPS